MKANTHPEYIETTVSCACGAVYKTCSTKSDMRIGICAVCHPFFTGQQKFVDTAGRVDKFRKRFGTTTMMEKKTEKKAEPKVEKKTEKKAKKK